MVFSLAVQDRRFASSSPPRPGRSACRSRRHLLSKYPDMVRYQEALNSVVVPEEAYNLPLGVPVKR